MVFVDEMELSAIFKELSLENQAKLLVKTRQARHQEKKGGEYRGAAARPDCKAPGMKEIRI